jgi:quercetin dioxygenase-like cupin family protein
MTAPRYFDRASAAATATGRFARIEERPAIEVSPGVVLRPVAGSALLLSHVTIEPDCVAEVHSHDEEQMGLVVEGSCEFSLGDEVRVLRPGDVYWAPAGVVHGARAVGGRCVIVDVFSPPRAALLELLAGR